MIEKLLPILERQEGLRNEVYRDSLGFWTIGCGYLISHDTRLTEADARRLVQAPWTDEQCRATLRKKAEETERALRWAFIWFGDLPEIAQMGLTDMAYQLGVRGVQGFPSMLKSLVSGDFEAAEQHALDSWGTPENPGWHAQTPARCEEVARMIGNRA